MRSILRRFPLLIILAGSWWLGCGTDPKPPPEPVDAGQPDAGETKRQPADPSVAAVDLFALAGEESVALRWSSVAEVKGVVEWVVDWGEEGSDFPNTFKAGVADSSQAVLEGLESGKTYELFISGLTETGQVAPEPVDGKRQPGSFFAQSSLIKVKTGPTRFGEAKELLGGPFDSAQVLPIDSRSMAVLYRSERALYASRSENRGASLSQGILIDELVQDVRAAIDPSRGIIVACYKTAGGIKVATSTDGGESFSSQVLAADEGPGCSVTFALGAFLVATEKPTESKVLVRRSEDGLNFSEPVVGAEFTNSGSSDPAIVADPVGRTVGGEQAEMVYLAWVEQRTSGNGGTDIYLSSSRDGARSFVSVNGRVVGRIVNEPIISAETNPTLAVDPESGRLWIAWEDRKTTPLVLLGVSEDFAQTAASGSLQWKPGNDLGGERVNPSLWVRPGGKLLVGFAAGSRANNKLPYVTLFDIEGTSSTGGKGRFEPPQPDAAISLKLGNNALAATTSETVEYAGPTVVGDPLIGEYAIWTTNEHGFQGDLEMALSP